MSAECLLPSVLKLEEGIHDQSDVLDQPAWFTSRENNKRWGDLSRSKEHSGWALTVKAGPEGPTIRDHQHDNPNGI